VHAAEIGVVPEGVHRSALFVEIAGCLQRHVEPHAAAILEAVRHGLRGLVDGHRHAFNVVLLDALRSGVAGHAHDAERHGIN